MRPFCGFSPFTNNDFLMVDEPYSSSANNSPNLTEEILRWRSEILRWKTDDLPDDGETTESSHQWTEEVVTETVELSEVLSDVEETVTVTTVSFSRCRHVRNAALR